MKIHNDEKIMIIAIMVCVLAGLFGFSFAYFSVTAQEPTGSTGDGINFTIPNNTTDVTFDAGNSAFDFDNAIPGTSKTKSFKVTVGNGKSSNYTIKLNISSNNFKKCAYDNNTYKEGENECKIGEKELVYTLRRENSIIANKKEVDITEATGAITLANETGSGEVNYTLEIEYVDTGKPQNHNKNKELSASFKVDFSN